MTLRLRINLLVGALTLLFAVAVIGVELRGMRDAVAEETAAANRVAAQLLDRTAWVHAAQGVPAMLSFLEGLGRIRSNDVRLLDAQGRELYRSPPSPYKAGRDAPDWFSRLISPAPAARSIQFPDGRLEVHANASRAVLDAWDEIAWLSGAALAMLVAIHGLVFWAVGRAVRPFGHIVAALDAMQAGDLGVQLPALPGKEAAAIGAAFNRMTAQLGAHIETERRAARAELQLSDSRELTRWIEQHIEDERKLIARELHDELGQSVTAMRSLALAIAGRTAAQDSESSQAARVIADEAARLYDAMHGIIPRLTPLVLDNFGLADALADLAERLRRSHPGLVVGCSVSFGETRVSGEAALALYRGAQEGLTNALRHGGATSVSLSVQAIDGQLTLDVRDNGQGPGHADASRGAPADGDADGGAIRGAADGRGHFGLRWLSERAQALGGSLALQPAEGGGARLTMRLPQAAEAAR